MKISVVTPTRDRPRELERLWRRFDAQTVPDKELIVLDDSVEPCAFLAGLRDPRLRYLHAPAAERTTIGAKRARLVAEAQGEIVAHFDDDDHYAPGYLAHMARALDEHGLDLVKLGAWFVWDEPGRGLWYWDTTTIAPLHHRVEAKIGARPIAMTGLGATKEEWIARQLWGYGFSYVYRRRLDVRFDPAMHHGEDLAFVKAAQAAGWKLRAIPDEEGLAVHVIHADNTSAVFPNYRLPAFLARTLFGDR